MADHEEDASLPSIRRSQRTMRRRPSRYGDDEGTALEDSCQDLGPADSTNLLEDSGQDENPTSLENVQQESAYDSDGLVSTTQYCLRMTR